LILSSALGEQSESAWLGLANFLPFFWLFINLRILINQPVQLRQLSWFLILPSLPIVILGYGQLFAAWNTPPLLESILGWEIVPQGVPTGRMSAVFIYTNFLAIYLAIAFSLALGLWLETWQVWRQKSTTKQIYTLLLLTLILLADISGLILTSSRNAWGLVVISFMAYAVYMGWRWLVYGVTAAATTILWASFAPNFGGMQLRQVVPAFFWARLSDQMYERPVETLRITQWQFCWNLIKERPWFGWGLRNFTSLYEAKMNIWLGHPHNLFLMLGAEVGVVATLLLIGIVGLVMTQAIKLLITWSDNDSQLIFFSYLVAFTSCILFNLSDVTIFDLRVNTIIWILLSAISGVVTAKCPENKIN
jgi:O-antigen ligase